MAKHSPMTTEEMINGLTVLRADNEIGEDFYRSIVSTLRAAEELAEYVARNFHFSLGAVEAVKNYRKAGETG